MPPEQVQSDTELRAARAEVGLDRGNPVADYFQYDLVLAVTY